mmetsp:Transcript_10626/g.30743  ORF Transcript_10626/g.30743 Transcript_10626/m.30743 type:complete len:81 (+) Transcript_10626:107-349(+)
MFVFSPDVSSFIRTHQETACIAQECSMDKLKVTQYFVHLITLQKLLTLEAELLGQVGGLVEGGSVFTCGHQLLHTQCPAR